MEHFFYTQQSVKFTAGVNTVIILTNVALDCDGFARIT